MVSAHLQPLLVAVAQNFPALLTLLVEAVLASSQATVPGAVTVKEMLPPLHKLVSRPRLNLGKGKTVILWVVESGQNVSGK